MSTSNPYKSFIALSVPRAFVSDLANLSHDTKYALSDSYAATDPEGGEWRTVGLVDTLTNFFYDVDGLAILTAVQFNERILPGAVRDEHLSNRVTELTERQGHKLSKKDFAQLKDETIHDLLPKAFIKRTRIPVMFHKDGLILVFTSSLKRCEDIMGLLNGMFAGWDAWHPRLIETVNSPIEWLNGIAEHEPDAEDVFAAGSSAVLKGENKRTIRVKDREIYSEEVEGLYAAGYDVHELAIESYPNGYGDGDDEEIELTFNLSKELVFKRVLFNKTVVDQAAQGADLEADFHSFSWLVAQRFGALASTVFNQMGGIRQKDAPVKPQPEEEDEL